jgi:NAD(P)-dependent dehydrogenase (short-subunit alcohol dehydrogenase family)
MVLPKRNLTGKVAIITGGGTGLGKAIALVLARAGGADVVVAGRRLEPLEQTAKEVRATGRRAVAVPTDVTDSRQVNRMIERTLSEMGRIDILITGTFFCCRAVAKDFLAQRSGKVINISAGGGLRGGRDNYAYCAAKAGVISLTCSLAWSWARVNIQVNNIAPGWFDVSDLQPQTEPRKIPANVVQERGTRIPVGRAGIPQEIGFLALFLASDASDYITGQTFIMDGGSLGAAHAPAGYVPVITLKEE